MADMELSGKIVIDAVAALEQLKNVEKMLNTLARKLKQFEKKGISLKKFYEDQNPTKKSKLDSAFLNDVKRRKADLKDQEQFDKKRVRNYNQEFLIRQKIENLNKPSKSRKVISGLDEAEIARRNSFIQATQSRYRDHLSSRGYSGERLDRVMSNTNWSYGRSQSINNTIDSREVRANLSLQKQKAREIEKQNSLLQRQRQHYGGILDSVFNIRNALIFMTASYVGQFLKGVIDVGLQFQNAEVRMQAVAKTSLEAGENIDWIKKRAEALKVPILEATDGFVRFYAAAKNNTPAEEIKKIYDSLLQTSAVMHINKYDFKLISLAIEQMASKGTVSMEELRRQLGERLPGTISLAAKAMGVTEAKLNDMVKSGKLLSKDFLLPFSQALVKEFGKNVPMALKSAQNRINDLNNQWMLLQDTLQSSGFMEAIGIIANDLAYILKSNTFKEFLRDLGYFLKQNAHNILPMIKNILQIIIFTQFALMIGRFKEAKMELSAISFILKTMGGFWGIIISLIGTYLIMNLDKVLVLTRQISEDIEYLGYTGWAGFWQLFETHGNQAIQRIKDKLNLLKETNRPQSVKDNVKKEWLSKKWTADIPFLRDQNLTEAQRGASMLNQQSGTNKFYAALTKAKGTTYYNISVKVDKADMTNEKDSKQIFAKAIKLADQKLNK